MSIFKRFTRALRAVDATSARGSAGARAYAVGDVHGCLDLLNRLIATVEEDIHSRPHAITYIIFLGDLIDRGPESAGVVERLRTYRPEFAQTVFLSGNHEEIMLRALAGEDGVLGDWLKFGGAECLTSYGVELDRLRRLGPRRAVEYLQSQIPSTHREFLSGFSDTFRFGDYIFAHAGIRPGIPLEEQEPADLRWIRQPFLNDDKNHGFVVVHGHTIVPAVEERTNRIAIDTGAYQSGVLTALAIEDGRRWYLDTNERTRSLPSSAPAS